MISENYGSCKHYFLKHFLELSGCSHYEFSSYDLKENQNHSLKWVLMNEQPFDIIIDIGVIYL